MSNFATYPNSNTGVTYGENLAQAARGFIMALFAGKPQVVHAKADVQAEAAPARTRVADIRKLYRLASEHDSLSPNLAAELRALAARN